MSTKRPVVRRFDPFRILTRDERTRHLDEYLRFLHERDGERDTEAFTLARREAFFRDIEAKPIRWKGFFDKTAFYQHLRDQARPEVDPRAVVLLSAAKANLGEQYGVEVELDAFRRRPYRATENALYLHLMFEERYHTRILAEICRTCGVESEKLPPSGFLRTMIHAMMYLPDRIRWIPIFAGEVLGSEVFNVLRDSADHFSAEPEVEARVRWLFTEIWIDEVFHAAYLRAKLGPIGIRIARLLLPLITISLFRHVPQGHKIGLTRRAVFARLRRGIEIPPGMDWMANDPSSD